MPCVFTIPPGAPFLETFASALLDGRVVPGLSRESGPLALAKTTIYVPTRRAGRALAAELARQSDNPAILLPRILPLGALDGERDETAFDNPLDPALPRAAGDIERRMILGDLILAWARNLSQAIVSIDADGAIRHAPESLLVAAHPADAWRLSGDLAALIDEMIIENIDWARLKNINGEFDEYWRITLNFLDIAMRAWPAVQQERGFVDKAARQQALIARAIEKAAHESDPVIAVGSTGSNIVTARLLKAIAYAPRGAVVLPGLDLRLDEESFAAIRNGDEPCATHPQAFLARLIETIGVTRAEIVTLGEAQGAQAARDAFCSEAFRPADSTDLWPRWRAAQEPGALEAALAGVTLVEAADEREEALAIAVILREALEHDGLTAALATPDRGLAERVRAELLRWNVEIDDSGGAPLAASPAGALSRLILLALKGAGADWAALVSHPAFSLGLGAEAERLARLFEIGVLRCDAAGDFWRDHIAPARAAAGGEHAHPRQREISDADWEALENFAEKLDAAFAPLRALAQAGETDLKPWLAAHRKALGLIVAGDESVLPAGDDGAALERLFAELETSANATFTFHAESYAAFFDALIGEQVLRGAARAHPRLKILGLLEARLIGVDRLVMAGLDETIWPPRGETDCFLNRAMRAQLGLSSPERRIGQTAHDFVQGFGAPEVVLSRAKKRGGAPATPSRFLQRMEALAGAPIFEELRARGARWLELARQLDAAPLAPPLRRPAPVPDLALRPKKLSVTRIETLRRDPYAIYAEFILRLLALPELDQEYGAREIGTALHEALEEFCRRHPAGPLPEHARDELIGLARDRLAAFGADPEFLAFRWPRLLQGLDVFLSFEAERRPLIERVEVELGGRLQIPLGDGSEFTLTAKADRIELLKDGTAAVVDYKSGRAPSNKEVGAGWSPQLTLEAAMLSQGAFHGVSMREAADAFYVPLGGGKDKARRVANGKGEPLGDLIAEHYEALIELLNDFRDPKKGYPARPFPQFALRYNDYDHLARTREWSAAGGEGGDDS
ncbi:double-strand break repair protein AddB [Rhodoblastus acidophilus]|uniref:Double-strand break repair protein AddB n=1 Tax=Candidatus Rhodoblastus alkanivorans TaxID=2954117 RepID=A0ABS9Z5R8_9HYPH|nr:double-strand break repair protein AddB [Candidatus Rhodoblastus alkanivorans]MCI4679744.1 double-strand break repair protein AddB [Candidatus Rhodoblastus alkanivorans]MCI4681982.1 double-strand break repair protein AddB [Candidatus Rhodoblastus alkanivorans]MDI4643033.1 double-strand break repair protein AddB [Rhodoblastus acidophilus]